MPQERNRVLAGECISRVQIETAGCPSESEIAAAIDTCDHERAAMLAFARARTESVPVALVGRILPGIEFPTVACGLIAVASGDRAELLAVLERRRIPQLKDLAELEAIVLFAAWRAGAPIPRVIPELRRLSVRTMTAEGFALLATIAQAIDDPNVAAATKHLTAFAKEHAKSVAADEKLMTAKIDAVIAALPGEVESSRGGFTVRAAQQVGRNDPCPCGSGLKYKKCCADKPVTERSPIAGVSWTEFLRGDKLTIEHIDELPLRDLARVELARLELKPLVAAVRRFSAAHEWTRALAAIEQIALREAATETHAWTDDCRDYVIHDLLACNELELARPLIAALPRPFAKPYDLDLAIADGPTQAWQTLVRVVSDTVASPDKLDDVDLAYTLLRAEPALGIIAARSCIGAMRVDDAEMLLDAVEEARDRLNLPPTDPAWAILDELTEDQKATPADDDAKLRLHESTARIDQLERSLDAVRTVLDAERTRPAAELMRAPERRDELDHKVAELEALIREGNAERRDLRRQLEATAAESPPADSERARPRRGARPDDRTDASDEGVDDLPAGTRGIALPRFDRRVADALAEVPAAVASEAMRTIGVLSAGDGFAWRGVKQAKDMARQVLMARVGIHHRLLFRVEAGVLDVIDLITRETLMTTLKRLRGR